MQVQHRLDQRQAEPGPFVLPAMRALQLPERAERLRDIVVRHADAGVHDGERERAIRLEPRGHRDVAAFGRELDGIGQEIHQHLTDAALVRKQERNVLRHVHADREFVLDRQILHQGDRVPDDLGDVAHVLAQLIGPGFDLGHVENVVDQLQQVLAAAVDVAGVVAIAGFVDRAEQLVLDDLGEADDGVERRPQLVAHVGEKHRLGAVGVFRLQLGGDQVLLHALAFGDVGDDADQVAFAARHLDHRFAREQPVFHAVGAGQRLLGLVRRASGEDLAVNLLEEGCLLARDDVVVGEADQRIVQPAYKLVERLVGEHEAQLLVLHKHGALN